jgi:CRISPR-associated protein Csb2
MIAFAFTFPVGRYHATPWGRHVNEADVAWPPEPVRILRALIATWWRKGDHERFPKVVLDDLIDALAAELPIFQLPEAVHTHVRAFMPAPVDRKLIYDAFFRLDRDAQMIVAWPNVVLAPDKLSLAAHLLERIGYLGRAESWAESFIAKHWNGEFNASPRSADTPTVKDMVPVDVAVPVTPRNWSELQERFMRELKHKAMSKRDRALTEATVPARLADALSVDTEQWQNAGWSNPPPLRKVIYDRPAVGPLPSRARPKSRPLGGQPGVPAVARYVLAGRPRPRIEDALHIAEVTRLALMGIGSGGVPVELSGRDERGPLRDDPIHRHAFYLPEDADRDGLIDHVIVYCRLGFSDEARRRLDRLTRLWIARGRTEEDGETGRKEWRVALEDIAAPSAFANSSRLLRRASVWESVTPYLKSRFDKRRPRTLEATIETYRRQIVVEWERRFPTTPPPGIEPVLDSANPRRFVVPVGQGRTLRSTLAFARTRGGRGGRQLDTAGGFFRLRFEKKVEGPVALGWGAHFGLGLFAAFDSRE